MISKRHRYDQGQYAILPREAINNSRLSFAARGLLLYLLEKPVDWMVSNEHLYAQSPAGERHINTVLTELKAAGYVHREKVYDPPTRTFRWDTTVYDFPEDNPHHQPDDAARPPADRTPTPRIPTKRRDTERRGTKRRDDLILDLPILNQDNPPPRARDASVPEPEAPAGAPAPLADTEDEFYAAARAFDEAARVARLARMSPDARRRAEALEQMVATLAEVTDTTVKANRSRLESVAAKIDEFTPQQVRRGFGDPDGWWWQEWYKGRDRRQKPTLYDIQEYIKRAAEWTPPATTGATGTAVPVVDNGRIDAAWSAVLRAIRRTGDNRAVMNELDEAAQAGVRAAGNLSAIRNMHPGINDRTIRARFAAGYRDALDRGPVAAPLFQPAQAAAD